MLFHTPIFFLFFAVFFAIYFISRKNLRVQNLIILVGSYVFYGAWDYRFLVLIIISTVTDYLVAIGAGREKLRKQQITKALLYLVGLSTLILSVDLTANLNYLMIIYVYAVFLWLITSWLEQKHDPSKLYLILSILVNLGILGIFKYFNFFVDNLVNLGNTFGFTLSEVTLNIVLPVGISFYTFQTMSYTIDVYRKKLKASHDILEVSAYIAFFPQLVAGPIERGAHLLPQFFKRRDVNLAVIRSGAYLFLWGLFKKAVIADNLSVLADPVFNAPQGHHSGEMLVALLAFSFQIYCDFSGYSDMARGIARMLGFNLMVNFNIPYISRTPSEFWQRWHISLSSWLRDYLYIPLGGNRSTSFNTYRNLFLTMLLGGLWHGASWTFILWGVTHGAILIIYRFLKIDSWIKNRDSKGLTLFSATTNLGLALFMFSMVVFTWLLFRAQTFDVVAAFVTGIFSFQHIAQASWLTLCLYLLPLLLHDAYQAYTKNGEFLAELPALVRVNVVLFIICAFIFLQPRGDVAFLYFDF